MSDDVLGKHFTRLTGQSTYRIWSVRIRSVLQSQGLWAYVQGKVEEPEKEKDESARSFNNRLKEYEIEKSKTTGILQQSLSQDIILDVEYLEEPQDVWTYLKSKYEPSGLAHQFAIYQEWQSIKYDGKGLEEFTHKYSQACARLKESKLDVSDTIKVYQFVTLISPWFETFTANLREKLRCLQKEEDLPKLDNIISSLLDENKAQQSNQGANFARNQPQDELRARKPNPRASASSSNGTKCSHCGSNHTERNCYHLHPEKAHSRYKPRPCNKAGCRLKTRFKDHEFQGKVKESENEPTLPNRNFYTNLLSQQCYTANPRISGRAARALKASKSKDSWILDSGASAHFTHELDKMFNFQPCDTPIEFGKGTARAKAFGSVKLELVGDCNRLVTFAEVFYIPELRANLLSTEKLREKGLFYRNDTQTLFTEDEVIANVYPYQRVPHIQIGGSNKALYSSHKLPSSKAKAST